MRARAAALLFPQLLDAFCHALQSLEAAAVFSPSLGVCLLLLIWGIVPKNIFAGGILVFTHRLICFLQLFPCLHTEDRRGERQRERERERETDRESEREGGREGKGEIER